MTAMNRTVHKYPLQLVGKQQVSMPAGAEILSAQEQNSTLCAWAAVNPGNPEKPRTFHIVGTGNPMPDTPVRFVGTVQQSSRSLVWHVFVSP